jgi:GNAT superfamily N-acetyltransferase
MSGGERAGPGAVRIRRARPGDAEAITAYHHRCWVEAFTDLLEPGVVAAMDRRGRRDRWRRWLDPGSELTTMVADLAGRPVGHTTVGAGELVHLVVDPDHWRRGLGRTLLAVGEELLAVDDHWDLRIWMEVDAELSVRRGTQRDGRRGPGRPRRRCSARGTASPRPSTWRRWTRSGERTA